jgi:hypothetical protein
VLNQNNFTLFLIIKTKFTFMKLVLPQKTESK